MRKQVKCQSGVQGWQCHLQENYPSFGDFQHYAELYGLHTRLGYDSPWEAWRTNPLIQGSVNPTDFRKV